MSFPMYSDTGGGLMKPSELLDSLVHRGVAVDGALILIRAYYEASAELYKVRPIDSSVDQSDATGTVASSRSSRRSERRKTYIEQCEDKIDESGFCYLRLVQVPSRMIVAKRIGAFPDTLALLGIKADEIDLPVLSRVRFVSQDNLRYHVEFGDNGNALDMLRRTLAVYKHHGLSMRRLLGEDDSDGDFFSQRCVFGAKQMLVPGADLPIIAPKEEVMVFDTQLDMLQAQDTLRDMIANRTPVNVVYHWSSESDNIATQTTEGYAVHCSPVDRKCLDMKCFSFNGVSVSSVLVLPPGVFAHDGDILAGSTSVTTAIVVDENSAFDIVIDPGVDPAVSNLSSVVGARDAGGTGIWLDVIRLEQSTREIWKDSSYCVDRRSADIRYASEHSVFTLYAVSYPQAYVQAYKDLVIDATPDYLRGLRFQDRRCASLIGTTLFSVDDHRSGRIRSFHSFGFESKVWQPTVISFALRLLSMQACVTVNVRRVQPVVSVHPVCQDRFSFSVSGMDFRLR